MVFGHLPSHKLMPKHPVELKPVLLAALISCYRAVTSVCRHVRSSHTVLFDKGLTPCSLVSVGTSPLDLSSLLAALILIHPSSSPFLGKCWGRIGCAPPWDHQGAAFDAPALSDVDGLLSALAVLGVGAGPSS